MCGLSAAHPWRTASAWSSIFCGTACRFAAGPQGGFLVQDLGYSVPSFAQPPPYLVVGFLVERRRVAISTPRALGNLFVSFLYLPLNTYISPRGSAVWPDTSKPATKASMLRSDSTNCVKEIERRCALKGDFSSSCSHPAL